MYHDDDVHYKKMHLSNSALRKKIPPLDMRLRSYNPLSHL